MKADHNPHHEGVNQTLSSIFTVFKPKRKIQIINLAQSFPTVLPYRPPLQSDLLDR